MSSFSNVWTMGVEEEYQIIDPSTQALANDAECLLSSVEPLLTQNIQVQPEMQGSQIEIATPICYTLAEVRSTLVAARQTVINAATQLNRQIAAMGTHPFSHWKDQPITANERYQKIEQRYQQLAYEQAISGCHVHIGCEDREMALQVTNRARLWLAPLLALSANSPFWLQDDTGYDSFRTEIWWRWPMAGPPPHVSSLAEYNSRLQQLVKTDSITDSSHLYWDIRISERFPTIEFRVTDACMTIDEAVMITGLIRALVQTCYRQALQEQPYLNVSRDLLRVAHWRAARYGLNTDLVDIQAEHLVPAPELIARMLAFLRPALESSGAWEEVSTLVHTTLVNGNGATRQRAIYRNTGSYRAVVDFIVRETASGTVTTATA
ncbi:MAG: carboxylate-amine ligase [Ktedonobacteraceae bacterium]|nr:carboxylate-amine ligase [Ktedonobacteraceae bacterium]